VLKFGTSNWTAEERDHLGTCPFCARVFAMFAAASAAVAEEKTVSNQAPEEKTQIGGKPPKAKGGPKPGEKPKPG
jgi:hypothetical protein